jgi:predicted nucleic acid-binding protein
MNEMIVLDTDVVIEILDKRSRKGDQALERIQASNESIGITAITLHELLYGLEKYAKRPLSEIAQIPVLAYSKDDAILSSKLELAAEKKGTPVRRADAMIAAVALNRSTQLYTFDRHFRAFQDAGLQLFS